MADFDWRTALLNVAPGLAAAFGGPAGPVLAMAVRTIGGALLGRPDASQADVEAALSQGLTGDHIVALKQAEQTFLLEMERIRADLEKAGLLDVGSARQQTVALAQAGSNIAWGAPVVSTLIVLGYFFCIYRLFIVQVDMPPNVFQLLNVMFGALSLAFGQVCNYWLGSSAGSKASGDAVRKIAAQGKA